MNKPVKVTSLKKAVDILNCFTKKNKLGVTEISEKLGLCKSNVHNILSTFEAMDYLEKDEETGKYQLGFGIFHLSRALGDSFSITKIAAPYMQEIADFTKERIYLGVPHMDEVIYLEAMYPTGEISLMRSLLGERAKMYCTGIGKAMLAFLPQDKIDEYCGLELKSYTESTITDAEILKKELRLIQQQGFAVDRMEHEFGIMCVAVPIFHNGKELIGAMSISGPSPRFTENRIKELYLLLKSRIEIIESRII